MQTALARQQGMSAGAADQQHNRVFRRRFVAAVVEHLHLEAMPPRQVDVHAREGGHRLQAAAVARHQAQRDEGVSEVARVAAADQERDVLGLRLQRIQAFVDAVQVALGRA